VVDLVDQNVVQLHLLTIEKVAQVVLVVAVGLVVVHQAQEETEILLQQVLLKDNQAVQVQVRQHLLHLLKELEVAVVELEVMVEAVVLVMPEVEAQEQQHKLHLLL
tara:strand:- start:236 stop:553 length:318 start_codon:yes stop_codon:yes gene_type:complete